MWLQPLFLFRKQPFPPGSMAAESPEKGPGLRPSPLRAQLWAALAVLTFVSNQEAARAVW